jgi:hypothetical protein
MADSATTRNRLRKQEVGEKTNAWGTDWNEDGGSDRLDEALDGFVAFTLSGAKTLTSTNYEADEARMRIINITGGTGGSITIPAVEKWYLIRNGTSGDVIVTNGTNSVTLVTTEINAVFTNGTTIYAANSKTYVDAAILNASLSASLPSQTGNAGKFIKTDGATASWAAVTFAAGSIASADLLTALTDETGAGLVVFSISPTLETPVLGVATATSINKVALTAPATGSTLTIADGKTLAANNSVTLAGTDSTTMTFPPASASVGYLNVPQNSQSAAYTTVMADGGKSIFHPSTDNNARIFTIDSNANVSYPVGTAITFVNMINTVTISITSDTMYLAGTGTTGSRTLAIYGVATAYKMTSTTWIISGTGLT